jgi:hypothetical protein
MVISILGFVIGSMLASFGDVPVRHDDSAPPITIVLVLPTVQCKCPASAQILNNDRTEYCDTTLCWNITNVMITPSDANCTLSGVECNYVAPYRCTFTLQCHVQLVDNCCCTGNTGDGDVTFNDPAIAGGLSTQGVVAFDPPQSISAWNDSPCAYSSSTIEVTLRCHNESPILAQVKYRIACDTCREQ